jgi:hypothetical protein
VTLQYQIDWDAKLPVSAQAGMADADAHADPRWRRWTDGAIQAVARRMQEFTADEVISELHSIPDFPRTHNGSALGPRLKEVAKELKYMEATDRVQRSKREASHGNFLRVWKSLIWSGK